MIKDKFYCTKCFYLTAEDTPPKECPICHSDRLLFDPVVKNREQFIPEYWEGYLDEKIEEIRTKQIKAGPLAATFGLVTDLHWASNEKHSAAILEKVMNAASIPYFFTGGDIVCGSGVCPKDSLFRELSEYDESFKRVEKKCLKVLGNHDQAYSTLPIPAYYVESLTTAETYEYYFRNESLYPDRVFGPTLDYYYADDKIRKTRFVALNTHVKPNDEIGDDGIGVFRAFTETGIMQEQLEWFANVALDVPSPEWTVVVATHEPSFTNSDFIIDVIDAFRRHTTFEGSYKNEEKPHYDLELSVDFTGRGGDFAIWVTGHLHCDKEFLKKDVLVVSTVNDSIHNSESSPFVHVKGTVSEQAMDFFTIDKNEHRIYATRVGCGESREFEYKVF